MDSKRVALVSGASGGIGAACASALAEKGYRVFGISRSGKAPAGVTGIPQDVTDAEGCARTVTEIVQKEGGIDLAVLAAGYGISGAVEYTAKEDATRQFAVNFSGVDNLLRALTEPLRARHGRVLAISSAAAVFPIPFQAHYAAAKAALNCFMRAYALEVRPFGIMAGAVMLGDCATGFTDARKKTEEGDALYGGRIGRGVAAMERDERGGMPPDRVAAAIIRILLKKRMPTLSTVGASYKLLCFLSRILPVRFQDFVLMKLYQ